MPDPDDDFDAVHVGEVYAGILPSGDPPMADSDPDVIASSAALAAAALGPKSVTVDGMTTVAQSPADLIAVDKYLRGKAAAASPRRGLRFTRLIPPGSV